jgi:serine/threonine protein kinase
MARYKVDQVIDGNNILKKLGEGAFSEVYLARNIIAGDEEFVLKIMIPQQESGTVLSRIRNEITILKGLEKHKHIAKFLDGGQLSNKDLYIKLEYIKGKTLAALLTKKNDHVPPLPLDKTRQAILDLLDALRFLHERDKPIIHRDINPKNLIWNSKRGLVIIDFNVSKIITKGVTTQTIVGTPPYIPPEIWRSNKPGASWSPASDLYAVGIVLYNMVTGQPDPFVNTKDRLTGKPPKTPKKVFPDLPSAIEKIILKAIAYEPADRFQSAREMEQAIRETWIDEESHKMTSAKEATETKPTEKDIEKLLDEGDLEQAEEALAELRRMDKTGTSKGILNRLDRRIVGLRQQKVAESLRDLRALLADEKQFNEGRIGTLLDGVQEMDPENKEVLRLREKTSEISKRLRERKLYDETLANCQKLWNSEQELVSAHVPKDEIINKVYIEALQLAKRAAGRETGSSLLMGLKQQAESQYNLARERYEAKKTADETGKYKELIETLSKEKDPGRLIPWFDPMGQSLPPITVEDARLEVRELANRYARLKAGEYLDLAKKHFIAHAPRAAKAELEKRHALFLLPDDMEKMLENYEKDPIEPDLKQLTEAERLLQQAERASDAETGWREVEQAVKKFAWVAGVEDVRRALAERLLRRAEYLLGEAKKSFEEYREQGEENKLSEAGEKGKQASGLVEMVRKYAAEQKWKEMEKRGVELLKKVKEIMSGHETESKLLITLAEKVEKLDGLLDEPKSALRYWNEQLTGKYDDNVLDRFSKLRTIRRRINEIQDIDSLREKYENVFMRADPRTKERITSADLERIIRALDDCTAEIKRSKNEERKAALRSLRERLQGRLDYLKGLQFQKKAGNSSEAIKYFERVANLAEHPDASDASKKTKEIRDAQKSEAKVEEALSDARNLLRQKKEPRTVYENLVQYKDVISTQKEEILKNLRKAREEWENSLVKEIQEQMGSKKPDSNRLHTLAKELSELPPPVPVAWVDQAEAKVSVIEAQAYTASGRWAEAIKSWQAALKKDDANVEYNHGLRYARLRQIESELGNAKGEKEAEDLLETLKKEKGMSDFPQAWEAIARYYYLIASKHSAQAMDRLPLYELANDAITQARNALMKMEENWNKEKKEEEKKEEEKKETSILRGRLDDLEKKISPEFKLVTDSSAIERKLLPNCSLEQFLQAKEEAETLLSRHPENAGLAGWWQKTIARTLKELKNRDGDLKDKEIWAKFEIRRKIMILDSADELAQELLRKIPALASNLCLEIESAVEDRGGTKVKPSSEDQDKKKTEDRVLDDQEALLYNLRSRAQTVLDILGRNQPTAGQQNGSLSSELSSALAKLQEFIRKISQLRQSRNQAQLYLTQAKGDDNWYNFDKEMVTINTSGFESHRSIVVLRKERDEIKGKRKGLDDWSADLRKAAEDPQGRKFTLAISLMKTLESDNEQGDPGDIYGVQATIKITDPRTKNPVSGWGPLKQWLQEREQQIKTLKDWLIACGLSNALLVYGFAKVKTPAEEPLGIISWEEEKGKIGELVDRGRFGEAQKRLQSVLEGETSTGEDGMEAQKSILGDRNNRLIALKPAKERLSTSPVSADDVLSQLADDLLEEAEIKIKGIETEINNVTKMQIEIKQKKGDWPPAERELDQAFQELKVVSAWQSFSTRQRIQAARTRVQAALLRCREICPKHPSLEGIENHPLLKG